MKIELRRLTIDDVNSGANLLDLKIEFSGTPLEVVRYTREKGYKPRKDKSVFGLRYVDKNGDSLLVT